MESNKLNLTYVTTEYISDYLQGRELSDHIQSRYEYCEEISHDWREQVQAKADQLGINITFRTIQHSPEYEDDTKSYCIRMYTIAQFERHVDRALFDLAGGV